MNNSGWSNNSNQAAWAPPAQQPWPVADKLSAPPKQVEPESSPYDAMTQDQVLIKWNELKKAVETAKEAEMDMRKYIVKRAFPDGKEGTNTAALGNGYELKAGIKKNYKLDTDLDNVEKALDDIEKMGNEGAFIAERLVKWSADFLLTEYRKLEAEDATDIQKKIKARIDSILTITDAAPTLEIKEPKKAKK